MVIDINIKIKGRSISRGIGEGEAMVTGQPLGFSHGLDPTTGQVSDHSHEWLGNSIKGKVLVFPYGKGSATGGLYILEAIKQGNAPAAVINLETDPVIAAGFILADVIYDVEIPVIDRLEKNPIEFIKTGDWIRVNANVGFIEICQ